MSPQSTLPIVFILLTIGCGGTSAKSTDVATSPQARAPEAMMGDTSPQTSAPESKPETEADPIEVLGPANSDESSILSFLQEGAWKSWVTESPIRPSVSAHGRLVQTFINRPLLESLRNKNTEHPQGSAAVKVLYASDGQTINGYAFEQKITTGNTGDAWVWYEGFTPDFQSSYYGQGLKLCASCHGSKGVDYVTINLSE